jgi:tRNA(fMet)-specific endonuclease VapC
MEVMLDTNAYCDWLCGGRWHEEISSAVTVSISAIVLGELHHGFLGGSRYEENLATLKEILIQPNVRVVDVDREIAEVFAEMVHYLIKSGTKIPTNDVWIAAAACVRGAVLLTSDDHFSRLPQVRRK